MRASWGARFVTRAPPAGNAAPGQRVIRRASGVATCCQAPGVSRGASRLCRDVAERRGPGGHAGPPRETIRHGWAGTLPSGGGIWGAISGPAVEQSVSRGASRLGGDAGERRGDRGGDIGPRGRATRLPWRVLVGPGRCRAAGGSGGRYRGPRSSNPSAEERHGWAGTLASGGGIGGGISGPAGEQPVCRGGSSLGRDAAERRGDLGGDIGARGRAIRQPRSVTAG